MNTSKVRLQSLPKYLGRRGRVGLRSASRAY